MFQTKRPTGGQIVLLGLCLLTACGNEQAEQNTVPSSSLQLTNTQPDTPAAPDVQSEADDLLSQPIASINTLPVSGYELNREAARIIGEDDANRLDEKTRRNLLNSLLLRRVISQQMMEKMSREERRRVEEEVTAFREKLLLKQHLAKFTKPGPVTDSMVLEYYNKNPQKFGAGLIHHYLLLYPGPDTSPANRSVLVSRLGELVNASDLVASARELSRNNPDLVLHQGPIANTMLPTILSDLASGMQPGDVDLLVHEGVTYLVGLLKTDEIPPAPFNTVNSEIRRALLSVNVRQAIADLRTRVFSTAEIRYLQDDTD